jgi:hypothetical protein
VTANDWVIFAPPLASEVMYFQPGEHRAETVMDSVPGSLAEAAQMYEGGHRR